MGVSGSLFAGNGKDDLLTWATCSPLTVSGSPGSRAYQTRCSIPRMAQWRGITKGATYPRCKDASRPYERDKLKKVRAREREWWWKSKKRRKKLRKGFSWTTGSFIQPRSAFGKSIGIPRILVRILSRWSDCAFSSPRAPGGMSMRGVDVCSRTDQTVTNPRAYPR